MGLKLKAFTKSLTARIAANRYDGRNRKMAAEALSSIESANGKLDRSLIVQANEYARDVLGWEGYAPWLHAYCAMSRQFKEGWIPDNYYYRVVVPRINGAYGRTSDKRALSKLLFKQETSPDIGYYVNGVLFDTDLRVIERGNMKNALFSERDKIVFKSDDTRQGKGVRVIDNRDFHASALGSLGNGVFQSFIDQHEVLENFRTGAVATLRITSVIDAKGAFSCRTCYLRLGSGGEASVKSALQIRVAIDPRTGAFSEFGYLPNWKRITRHPDSQVEFKGNAYPFLDKCIQVILALHTRIPFVQCIGWDVAVEKDNTVKVMEWNGGYNDIKFSEATQGPCFSDLRWEQLWKRI